MTIGLALEKALRGHKQAQGTMLAAIHGPRMHHGWLLHGPRGVGKARFAAQASAYLVAADARLNDTSLDVDLTHPDVRLLLQGAHPDALWIDRTSSSRSIPGAKKTPRTIPVSAVRETLHKLHATAAYGGWRTVVIDAVDDLNIEGANALLKPLEEPSRHTALFLVAHSLSRVLPTIRSRCRHLAFAPLGEDDMHSLVDAVEDSDAQTTALAIALSGGSAGQAAQLAANAQIIADYSQFCALAGSPAGETAARLTFASNLAGLDDDERALLLSLLEDWLSRRVRGLDEPGELPTPAGVLSPPLANELAQLWSDHSAAIDVRRAINLDLSETIMALFDRVDRVYSRGR